MDAREVLFRSFPRTVGNPGQYLIYNAAQFNWFASVNSGNNDQCYSSVCSFYNGAPVTENLFLENDCTDLNAGLIPVRKVILWYEAHNIPWICLFSANRSYHLHGLFEPELLSPKTIRKFADMILEQTGTTGLFDTHVIGDARRLCRIPNTQRDNGLWCIPLSRETIFNKNAAYIKSLAATPQFLSYTDIKRPKISDFIEVKKETITVQREITIAGCKEIFMLRDVLRPCIFKKICEPNPRENIRLTATIEAMNHGITVSQLIGAYEKLGWVDWDRNYTRYKIEILEHKRNIEKDYLIPFTKKQIGCTKKTTCLKCILKGDEWNELK